MGTFESFVGTQTGLLKGISLQEDRWININKIKVVEKNNEIICMCWGDKEESEVCCGTRDQHLQIHSKIDPNAVAQTPSVIDFARGNKSTLAGVCKFKSGFVTCTEEGLLRVWNEASTETLKQEVGKNIEFLRQNPSQPNIISTGGKENEIKTWDLESQAANIFTAKNPKNDWLSLRVPIWVADMAFVPDSQLLFTCTGYHQVRLYDTRAQKRPVIEVLFKESPIKTLSLNTLNHKQVVVGNTQGLVGLLDFRGKDGSLVHTFSGVTGGVRVVKCVPNTPLMMCGGLDRFLRVYNINNKKLIHKKYLKAMINDILVRSDLTIDQILNNQIPIDKPTFKKKPKIIENEELKEIWEGMEVVETKKVKRKSKKEVVEEIQRDRKKHLKNLRKRKRESSGSVQDEENDFDSD